MNNSKRALVLGSIVLAMGLAMPAVSFADPIVDAVNSLKSNNQTVINNLKSSNQSELSSLRAEVAKAGDYSRENVAAAIIRYEAEARLKEYELNEALLFMPAPGVQWAIQTGRGVGEANIADRAQELVDASFQELMSQYWPTEEQIAQQNLSEVLTEGGVPVGMRVQVSPRQSMYDRYIAGQVGEDGDLSALNMGEVLRLDKTTNDLAKQFINIVIGSDMKIDTEAVQRIRETEAAASALGVDSPDTVLAPAEKEDIAGSLINAVNMTPSTNIISGILSRRLLSPEYEADPGAHSDAKTAMELIEKYASDRFQNTEWYGEVGRSSDTALLREMTHMMAYNAWMQLQAFKLQEQTASALAIMNANFARLYNVMQQFAENFDEEKEEARRALLEAEQRLRDIEVDDEDLDEVE